MAASNTLQAPSAGRSRFSKALPAVPGLTDIDHTPLPPLPDKVPRKDLPHPPRKDSIGQGSRPPFSPLSSIASPTISLRTPTSARTQMVIPRKAVGGGSNKQQPSKTPAPASNMNATSPTAHPACLTPGTPPALSPDQFPAIASKTTPPIEAQPPLSPSESLSSLLSAYSRSSTNSPVISSEGAASFRDSQQALSPEEIDSSHSATVVLTADSKSVAATSVVRPKEVNYSSFRNDAPPPSLPPKPTLEIAPLDSLPPRPPAKDVVSHLPVSPSPRSQPPKPELGEASPPRPQLWRRRSLNKSKDLPDLRLNTSHGSTAASSSHSAVPIEAETASVKTQSTAETIKPSAPVPSKPLPPITGLPGRNVRPMDARNQESEATTAMGNKVSKTKQLLDKDLPSIDKVTTPRNDVTRPGAARPPTPEYQKEDVKTPMLETVASPVSPASSPEPNQFVSPPVTKTNDRVGETKQRPLQPLRIDTQSFAQNPAVPAQATAPESNSASAGPTTRPDLYGAPSGAPSASHSRSTTPSLSNGQLPSFPQVPSAMGGPNRARQDSDAASIRGRNPGDTSMFPPRGASARPDGQRVPLQQQPSRNSAPESNDPRLVRSNSRGMLYRGRDGTLYPEMKELPEPDAKAAFFPLHPQGVIPEGTILPAPPLRNTHYLCYQKHRNMARRVNRQYPLACQTCEKADVEDRWVCSFCQLRMCAPCLEIFDAKKRDLRELVTSVKVMETTHNPKLSLNQLDSGLGLQIGF